MSYDSLFAYKESIDGIVTAVWPPMHAYLFYLSRISGAGVGGLFYGQTFLLFFSAFLILSMFIRAIIEFAAGCLTFSAFFFWIPTLWGTLGVIWKDVTTTSFALFGIALWMVAIREKSFLWLAGAAAAFFFSVALRYNAFPLTFFVIVLMVACPFGDERRRFDRPVAAAMLFSALMLAYASTIIRLPDFQRLPSDTGFAAVQEFDLIGITACSGTNYVPPGLSKGETISADQIRQLYDPRHVQLAFRPRPGIPPLFLANEETDADGAVERSWATVVPRELGCYLKHRAAVFVQQMGLAPNLFYPTNGGIDPNEYGLSVARPGMAAEWTHAILDGAGRLYRRPILVYALALILVGIALWRQAAGRRLMAAMLTGAFAYPATLFFVGPAADARYIFPSSVMCALVSVMAIGQPGSPGWWDADGAKRSRSLRSHSAARARPRWGRAELGRELKSHTRPGFR